jgi:hypothetical protein
VADLASVGVIVSSVSDLLVRREPYPEAIPVLLQHLQQPHMDNVRDMLARSLATPQASYAHHLLVMEYRKQVAIDKFSGKISYVADGLAVAIAVTVQEEDMQSLLELAKEESLGDSRVLFLLRLKKSKNKVIVDALRELAFDPTFSKEIASWKTSSRKL